MQRVRLTPCDILQNMKKRKLIIMIGILLAFVLAIIGVSAYVTASTADDIALIYKGGEIENTQIEEMKGYNPQCILVLGCAVWDNNQPSPMLKDRLALYKSGAAPKLLLSGDNSRAEYSEPDCMYQYALGQGVPKEDIFLDFAGFSTYDSMYRAKVVFCVDRAIVVTQKYHLFRALKIGKSLGVEVRGVAANQRKYAGRYGRETREVLARDKDFVKCIVKPEPTFLGDKIPIDGNGGTTHLT